MNEPTIYTKEGKIQFINSLMDSIKEGLLEKVDRMPDEWSGIELRWLIKEYVNEQASFGGLGTQRSRKKNFNNIRYNKNI